MVAQANGGSRRPQWSCFRDGSRPAYRGLQAAVWAVTLACLAAVMPMFAQQPPALDEVLDPLREQVRRYAENATNYTCLIDLERVQNRTGEPARMEESARLEVAVIDGQERFAWPGEARFRDDEVRNMLVFGLSGAGSFVQHLRSVVLDQGTRFGQPRLETAEGGQRVVIPWSSPASSSGYLVNVDGKELEAATEGELALTWPDRVLASFRLRAMELPVDFPAKAVEESISFARPSDTAGFRVPNEATQRLTERTGDDFVNTLRFRDCRGFGADSAVRFEEPTAEKPSPAQENAGATATLPAGVPVDLELRHAIEWGKNRTGDPVEATLTRDIKWKGELLAREGDLVRGRLAELKRYSGKNPGYLIGLQFTEIIPKQKKAKTFVTRLSLESLPDQPKSPRRGLAAMALGRERAMRMIDRVGPDGRSFRSGGFLQFTGEELDFPGGYPMRWVVIADEESTTTPWR